MATERDTNRSIIFLVICICLGVLILVAIGQSRESEPAEIPLGEGIVRLGDRAVAQINGTSIYLSDVRNVASAQYPGQDMSELEPGDKKFDMVLDELIDQRLMALEALSLSLDQQAKAKRRLAQARERILSNVLVEHHLQATVNDQTALQMYEAQSALRQRGIEVRARQIIVPDKETADMIVERLGEGELFRDLAIDYSTDRVSRDLGGDLGYFTRDMLDPTLTRKAFAAKKGEIVPPFETGFGWHVLEVRDRRRAPQPSFEEMKSAIIERMTYDELQKLIDGLRDMASIERLTLEPASKPVEPTPTETAPDSEE